MGWGKTGTEIKDWEIKLISLALSKQVEKITPRAAFQGKIELKTWYFHPQVAAWHLRVTELNSITL